jgi:hypothetical protein
LEHDRGSSSDNCRGRGRGGRDGRGFTGRGRGRSSDFGGRGRGRSSEFGGRGRGRSSDFGGGRFGQRDGGGRGRGRGIGGDYQRNFPPANREERGVDRDRDPHFVQSSYHHNSNRNNEGNNIWTARRGEDDGFPPPPKSASSFASMALSRETSSNFSPPPPPSNKNNNDVSASSTTTKEEEKEVVVVNNSAMKTAQTKGEVIDVEKGEDNDTKKQKQPLKITPPPKGKPTGIMLALSRLIELEASMEYAYTKHMLLVNRRKELQHKQKVLESLEIGLDAIQEDLEKPRPAGDLYD